MLSAFLEELKKDKKLLYEAQNVTSSNFKHR